jgi:hypothetical protein
MDNNRPTTAYPWKPPGVGAGVPSPNISQLLPATTEHNSTNKMALTQPGPTRHLPRVPTLAALAGRPLGISADSAVMEIWEGVVLNVDFDARWMDVTLEAKTTQIPLHTGRIDLEWVTDQDMDLLRPGAVFYLTLYRQSIQGTIRNAQELRFRRRPGWSKEQLDKVAHDAAAISGKLKARPVSE